MGSPGMPDRGDIEYVTNPERPARMALKVHGDEKSINAGVPIKPVQEHLGHSSITVTMDRYAHLYPEARRTVAAVLDGLIADVSDVENRTEADQTRFGSQSR